MKLRDVTINADGRATLYFEEGLDGVEVSIDPGLASQCVSAALLAFAESLSPGLELRPVRETVTLLPGQHLPPITNIRPPNRRGGPPPSDVAGPLSRMNERAREEAVERTGRFIDDVAQASLARAPIDTAVRATEAYLQSLTAQQVIRGFEVTANGEDVSVKFLRTDGIEAGGVLTSDRRMERAEEFFSVLRDSADMPAGEFGDD